MRALYPVIFSLVLGLSFFSSSAVATASGLPCSNPHVATAADIAAGYPAGSQVCPSDQSQTGVTADSGQAKQDLNTMWCGGKPSQCSPDGITGLDPNFAVCADKFMKQLRQVSPSACIRSAYRSYQGQICACGGNAAGIPGKCAPAGKSYHQKGLAIDVNHPGASNEQFWSIASQAGLENPSGLHSSDPDHIQATGGATNCAQAGYVPPNSTGNVTPPGSNIPFDSQVRQMVSPTPPPPPPPQQPVQSSAAAPAPVAAPAPGVTQPAGQSCTPQYSCTGSALIYQNAACVTQTVQTCPNGCDPSGTTCANAPASSGGLPPGTLSTSTSTDQSGGDSLSANALIQQYAYPSTSDIGTATPIDVNALDQNLNGTVELQAGGAGAPGVIAQGNSAQLSGAPAQQTFTSGDLANNPSSGGQSYVSGIFAQMQSVLLSMLVYLKPFGGIVPGQLQSTE